MIKRYILILLALFSFLAGLLTLPLPLPTGIPLLALALALTLNISRGAKVMYVKLRRRLSIDNRLAKMLLAIERQLRRKKLKAK